MNVQFYIDHTQDNIPGEVRKKKKKLSISGGNRFYSESNERGVDQYRTMEVGVDLNRIGYSSNDFSYLYSLSTTSIFVSLFL